MFHVLAIRQQQIYKRAIQISAIDIKHRYLFRYLKPFIYINQTINIKTIIYQTITNSNEFAIFNIHTM